MSRYDTWTPEDSKELDRLISRQNNHARRMWVLRPVAHILMWLGFARPEWHKRGCAEALEIYEAQASLLGISRRTK